MNIQKLDGIKYTKEMIELGSLNYTKKNFSSSKQVQELIHHKNVCCVRLITDLCESEIERQFGYALYFCLMYQNVNIFVPMIQKSSDKISEEIIQKLIKQADVLICPNIWLDKKTRPDFMIWYKLPQKRTYKKLIIECDSFQYHSSPDQLYKEKVRERRMMKTGIPILRFSGKEITKNPTKVAQEVIDFMFEQNGKK